MQWGISGAPAEAAASPSVSYVTAASWLLVPFQVPLAVPLIRAPLLWDANIAWDAGMSRALQ